MLLTTAHRLPDASVKSYYVAADIAQLGARGAGGIEFNNYYNYGGTEVYSWPFPSI